jgi:DNA-binding transcriptional LysR family regulator
MPHFLVSEELREGRLVSIAGPQLPGHAEKLVAARRSDRAHGPVAQALWEALRAEAPRLRGWLRDASRVTASASPPVGRAR